METEEEHSMFCFLGDTSTFILKEGSTAAERIFSCATIIIECSFLTDDCKDNAERTKHVLWSELRPYIISHPNTTFVLTHFSHRWSVNEIETFFENENLPNVIPWTPADTRIVLSRYR